MSARVAWLVAGMLAFGMVAATGLSSTFEDADLALTEDAAARHPCPPDEPQQTVCACLHPTQCKPFHCQSSSQTVLRVTC